ncbi:MAG: orotidine-5'-phosphate decarboxylase [Acidobacteria bacterium]|nr:orotidine-5'-phosphate decarboxylase [Acidobacteriota bacterium]
MTNVRDRIIVALDVDSADDASAIVSQLNGRVGAFKVGLQLFTAAGPAFVRELTASGAKVFLDLKFHDIPNTVAKASVEAARLGVWMFNVHAAGGSEMMRTAVKEVEAMCEEEGIDRPLVIGVTVLTSSNAEMMGEIGINGEVESQVIRLAKLTAESGLDGVVASPLDVAAIRNTVADPKFLTVTPGIRPFSATADDQKRVTTVGRALAGGSDYVVIGRPITQAANRVEAVEAIVSEVNEQN